MHVTKTSVTHPLEIAFVEAGMGLGRVGVTFCPGKVQPDALSGAWERDLDIDLDAIEAWGAAAVVTLIEPGEMAALNVDALGEGVADRHMSWFHLPVRDVSTPDARFEAEWMVSGEAIRSILRSGFDVVVHCKGGLGRAGMIAARLLVELGWEPAEAVTAVRQVRRGAIETAAQYEHVLNTSAVPEPNRDASDAAVQDRALGCLLGLAVGDAVGTSLEFSARDSKPRQTDMTGGGPFRLRAGEWTDDTSMALALADSLLAHGALVEADLMSRFLAWWRNGHYSCTGTCFDIGIQTSEALARFERTNDPVAGSKDPRRAGNGSLMRVAPVVLHGLGTGIPGAPEAAARQSATTHGAETCLESCRWFAFLLYLAVAGKDRSFLFSFPGSSGDETVAAILAGSWRGKPRAQISSSGYVAHSLEAALWSVARTTSFEDAVLLAANLGDDADTTAAITGQLAGALYGASGIPERWLGRLAWREKIEEAGLALLRGGQQKPVFAPSF